MGFGIFDLRFLFSAEKLGFRGKDICTLGRQTSYKGQRELDKVLSEWGKPRFLLPKNKALLTAEDFLEPLGYRVTSLDASPYEGATLIHDLNQQIPDNLASKFDLVIDGGTLEHVFNYPVALQNAMKMLRVGGRLFLMTPANNQCGHGFYQFSPELFYSVLVPANGFELRRIYLSYRKKFYHVANPASTGGRVELVSPRSASLCIDAEKVADVPFIGVQQSDYLSDWSHQKPQDGALKAFLRQRLSDDQIARISNTLNHLRVRRAVWRWKKNARISNRRFYRPVTNLTTLTRNAF